MTSLAILLISTIVSASASHLAHPLAFYSPVAAPFFRTQYHTQATYPSPVVYYNGYPSVYAAAAPAPVAPLAYAPAFPAPVASQYHSQNHLGEASYGYAFPGQAHSAVRDALGGVTGAYQYIDAEGKPVYVNYRADSEKGFQVSSNVLPVAPKVDLVQPVHNQEGPEPVQDTPEVKAAKEEHQKAVEAAKAHADYQAEETKSRRKRSAIFYHGLPAVPHPVYPAFYPQPYAYSAPFVPVVKTLAYKTITPIEGTPASTYKFDLV